MHEAIFRTEYDSLYSELSENYDVKLKLWCNNRWDAVSIRGQENNPAIRTIKNEIGIYESLVSGDEATVFTQDCLLEHGSEFIEKYLHKHNCLLLPPFSYENGIVQLRLIAQDLEQLTHLFHDLQQEHSLTVDMKQTVDSVSLTQNIIETDRTSSGLSQRQENALIMACEQGYYEIPRRITTKDLAEQYGVTRRTFEDHLRKAEQKVILEFKQKYD